MNEDLMHYGMPRRSGRYPWGSGEDPYQSAISFRGMVQELRQKGLSEVEIARGLGINTSQLRARLSLAKDEIREAQRTEILKLKEKGMSNVAIGKQMNIPESSVRSLLDPVLAERALITKATSNMLKESVAKYGYIDVGKGVENHIGVSRQRLKTAISELEEQGFKIHYVKIEQQGIPGQYTSVMVLAGPDSTYSEIVKNKDLIQPITGRSDDMGRSYTSVLGVGPIESISSSKVQVKYYEDGGADKDGVIELRRGVENLDLGQSRYAQVRIGVDGTHYLKGMAIYSDDMPDGIDIVFNTNKHNNVSKMDTMKQMQRTIDGEIDSDNPFGSTIGAQRGALNIVGSTAKAHEEGTWDTWSRNLSSQVLSKQPPSLAKQQLEIAFNKKQHEFDEIMLLTNPTVKKELLNKFADSCDSDSVHLRAAALPRQSTKVILPITKLKENEIYAPTYKDGESVVLIRHPHGGTFEIPQLIVNNKSKEAKSIMENAQDAVGINPRVAARLSGADFDGDTVLVIPNNKGLVKTQAALRGLQNFDPIESYKIPENSKIKPMTEKYKQTQMGVVSNLITDMTIKGANTDEIARAVRHSMVVIDAVKHNLNYRQSYIDNGIASLAEKYQGRASGGASTLISKAKSEVRIPEQTPGAFVGPISEKTGKPTKIYIDPQTGQRLYTETGATYTKTIINKKTGEVTTKELPKTTKTSKMAITADARTLSSGTPMETIYANHANQLKALANSARKESLKVKSIPYSPSAKITYSQEVSTLKAKLNIALKNKPLERQAQIIANAVADKKIKANPKIEKDEKTKIKTQALTEARTRVGAKKQMIEITSKEWEAIQAGAVSNNTLTQILNNTNLDTVKKYATPKKTTPKLSSAKLSRARRMLENGLTQAQVAEALGVSVFALVDALY